MQRDWHETFARWAKPPSETEESKAERAARMIRDTLRRSNALRGRDFDIVALGSYRNNTNVRSSSDVDLAAVLRSAQWSVLPSDGSLTRDALGLKDVDYGLVEFRRDLYAALRESLGAQDVAPGKIAVTVDESSARLAADLTPYLVHRRYTGQRITTGAWESHEGIETRPSDSPNRRIIQWPEQHYQRGAVKNEATNRRYKRVVRILKCLRNELSETGSADARATKSCFLEHAVYNVPHERFNRSEGTYYDDVKGVVTHLWQVARDQRAARLTEGSEMQLLFRSDESWTPGLLETIMLAMWQHVGFSTP